MSYSQLAEYHARKCALPIIPIPDVSQKAEKWESLHDQYGLSDMFDDQVDVAQEMSLDEEYASFVNAPLSPKGTPLIQFWEVII